MSKIQEAIRKAQQSESGKKIPREPVRPLAALDETITLSTLREDEIPQHLADADSRYAGRPIVVSEEELISAGFLATGAVQRRLADEFRIIKRPIIASARGKKATRPERGNIVMIASAMSAEGKTFTCINLALSVAREKDWSVVLVDVDCIKQHLTSMFSATNELGLLDLLKDPSIHPNELIMPTNIPSLSILPAGQRDDNAAELLASERMDQVVRILGEEDKFRIVIMDSSPLLLTTEAEILSTHVGQVALVVHAGHTSQSAVTAAVQKLDPNKAINAILNQSEKSASASYGDYYGDYYGQEASEPGRD